jgi:putative peptidoglycan lipid II flippase
VLGYSVVKIVSPTFYALQDARTPVLISVFTIGLNLVLNLWLNSIYGFTGLALGTAIAANVNAGLLLYLLSRRLGGGDFARILVTLVKVSLASAAMGVAAHYAHGWLLTQFAEPVLWHRFVRVIGAIGVAIAVLTATAYVLRIEELRAALARVFGRLQKP